MDSDVKLRGLPRDVIRACEDIHYISVHGKMGPPAVIHPKYPGFDILLAAVRAQAYFMNAEQEKLDKEYRRQRYIELKREFGDQYG
jgi:hypothetical protein